MKTDTNELAPYLNENWSLIPLHRWDMIDDKKRERGKSPRDGNWTRKIYKNKDQIEHMKSGANVGVRLRAEDLVIDVDPRNFEEGDDPLARLCEDCGIDPNQCPTVETGSGGFHIYMKKPGDVSIRDSLPDYKGVEFKTIGRQVVAPGSIHPSTKKMYVWDFTRPPLDKIRQAPDRLLNIIRRPNRALSTGGGEHTQEELAEMLDKLDPEDFRDHDNWLTLMQACHHATAGDGRSEFIEWCTRDPLYTDHSGVIGLRWDSLHADNDGGARVTYRTLHKIMRDGGFAEAVPQRSAEDDFEAVGPEDLPFDDPSVEEMPEHEKKGPLERMNDKYWAVMEGGQFKVMWEVEDPSTAIPEKKVPARKMWVRAKLWDFKNMLANRKVQREDKAVPLSDAWIEWGGRRSADGVVFDPEHDHKGFLNLWTGWGTDPRKGEWSLLNELLFEVLCDGEDDVYKYVMDWAAYMVQHPGRPAEVAICFQGGKGTGKGTWGRALASLAGKHGMQITSSEQLTGRFNDHLRDVILLFADEALKPYDKDGESRLKGLITEPRLAYEGKGRDVISAKNMLHIVMASNEDWFIPAGLDGERRFMLSRTNNKRIGQHKWFEKLHDQLDRGGLSALLWDLLHRDIGNWSPRQQVPATSGLIEQKIRNLGPVEQWWFNAVKDGELPFETAKADQDWLFDNELSSFYQDVRGSFDAFCTTNGIRHGSMGRSLDMLFAKEIKKLVPTLGTNQRSPVPEERFDIKTQHDGRARIYVFPDLVTCRNSFEQLFGGKIDWEGIDE